MTLEQFKDQIIPIKNKLYRYAVSRVFDTELAKDIVQDVLVKLWEQRSQLTQVKNIEAWAIRCTRNLSIDRLKASGNKVLEIKEAYHLQSKTKLESRVENDDLINWVKTIIVLLPEKQREIFRLRELLGYSNAEICDILELDENQVKVNLFRARKKVKEALLKKVNYGLGA